MQVIGPSAPYLRELTIASEDNHPESIYQGLFAIPDSFLAEGTPRLHSLCLHNCGISWKSNLFQGLTSLEVVFSWQGRRFFCQDFLHAMERMPQLTTLTLYDPFAQPDFTPIREGRLVTMPQLRFVNLRLDLTTVNKLLEHVSLPRLRSLLFCASSDAPAIEAWGRRMPSLWANMPPSQLPVAAGQIYAPSIVIYGHTLFASVKM
ncbi:hypothetical protein CC2G_010080 [Coprinopsis cinerea AmutBmut pab1-1]|nr:hypothetical protein CC2G_010080 [Coprinopsis cinerea AmutBmut pab1-1]